MSSPTRLVLLALAPACLVLLAAAPAPADPYYSPDDLHPPAVMESQTGVVTTYPGLGIMMQNVRMTTADRFAAPPPPEYLVDSFFDVFTEVSIDGGSSWTGLTLKSSNPSVIRIRESPTLPSVYDTEMLSLNLTGNSPFGPVMIRESPTLASTGHTSITSLGGGGSGGFMVDSFFDVFTELSVDGGQTWAPSQSPTHVAGTPEPATLALLAMCSLGALGWKWRGRRRG